MAARRWLGTALNTKQVATLTIANTWATNDTVTLTINNVTITITIGTLVTTTQVATTVFQAFTGATLTDTTASYSVDNGAVAQPMFYELIATNPSAGVVRFTARTAGKPFTMTAGEVTAGSGTATLADTTANEGQYEADNVDNWSGNAVPADNDTVSFDEGSVDCLDNLNLACQPLILNKTKAYTGRVGRALTNRENPSLPYAEYRTPLYLTTDDNSAILVANLETGMVGAGSSRFMHDGGAGQCLWNIFGMGRREFSGTPAILLKGSHASNILNNLNGDVGFAFLDGETATLATLVNGDGPQSGAQTICGSGTTLGTVVVNGGTLQTNSAITAATINGGKHYHRLGTVAAATVNKGGTLFPLSTATITTLTLNPGGICDCRGGGGSFTITNTIQMFPGSSFIDPQGRAGNIVVKLNGGTLADYTIITPYGKTITFS